MCENAYPDIRTKADYERYQQAFAKATEGFAIVTTAREYRHTYRCDDPECDGRETVLETFDPEAPETTDCQFWCDGKAKLVEADEEGESLYGFSWLPCNICHRALGGDREHMALTNPGDTPILYVVGCIDCAYYSEYGQLDDMTMLEIEKAC